MKIKPCDCDFSDKKIIYTTLETYATEQIELNESVHIGAPKTNIQMKCQAAFIFDTSVFIGAGHKR